MSKPASVMLLRTLQSSLSLMCTRLTWHKAVDALVDSLADLLVLSIVRLL